MAASGNGKSRHDELCGHTITINKGIGKLQTSSVKFIHLIDLQQIKIELLKIREHAIKDLKTSYLFHTLTHELVQSVSPLNTLTFQDRQIDQ